MWPVGFATLVCVNILCHKSIISGVGNVVGGQQEFRFKNHVLVLDECMALWGELYSITIIVSQRVIA